jgi:hypothetical protein
VASIGDEPIVRKRESFREHQRRAGGVVAKRVPFEPVAIGIHVVEPVTHALDVVIAHVGAVDEREVDAVARITNDVPPDEVAGRVPDVDAIATPVLIECDHAQLAFGGLQTILQRIYSFHGLGAPDDRVALDSCAVRLPDVDAMKTVGDAIPTNSDASTRRVDARVILLQFQTGPADPETFDRHIVSPDGHHVRAAVADELGTTVTDEPHRPRDRERTGVDTGRNLNGLARCRQREPLTEPGSPIARDGARCSERDEPDAQCSRQRDDNGSKRPHSSSCRDIQIAERIANKNRPMQAVPDIGRLVCTKLAICWRPITTGVNGATCIGASRKAVRSERIAPGSVASVLNRPSRCALIAGRPSSDISCRTRDFSPSGQNSPLE